MRSEILGAPTQRPAHGLVDVLDRVLDKGLVVAGDIKVSLAEVELLTIRIRLIVCSLDKAQEIGLDWWRYDQHFSPRIKLDEALRLENEALKDKIRKLEKRVGALGATPHKNGSSGRSGNGRRRT